MLGNRSESEIGRSLRSELHRRGLRFRKHAAPLERDRRNDAALSEAGWTALRLWAHVEVDEMADCVVVAVEAGP